MGALVGGVYAAGGLDAFKEWMKTVDRMKVFNLMDFTIGNGGFVKGERVIDELKAIIPDRKIEELPIRFTAVATDILHRREVVFDSGSLYDAIRSSISLPSVFTPNRIGDMLLIDGGVVNPVPVNRVPRTPGDILVAVDLNGGRGAGAQERPYASETGADSGYGHGQGPERGGGQGTEDRQG